MIPTEHLEADLRDSLRGLATTPLAELLLQHGILRRLAEEHLRRRLRDAVQFSAEEEPLVIGRLWQGIALDPPPSLAAGWIEALPEMLQGPVRERWDQIRLQKWMEEAYRDQVEPYFLERRADLEQVVYGMIRLRQQGAAEELYLRLLDDAADFGELARTHSLGEERFTRGLVGPMRISQPHPTIRAVLQKLAVGDLHPPFTVDNWVLLVRMEHRQPASLNDATLLQLSQELLQRDLDALVDARLQELYPALVSGWPGLAPAAAAGAVQASAAVSPPLAPDPASLMPAAGPDASPPALQPPPAAPEPPDQVSASAPALSPPPASTATELSVPQPAPASAPAASPLPPPPPPPDPSAAAAAGSDRAAPPSAVHAADQAGHRSAVEAEDPAAEPLQPAAAPAEVPAGAGGGDARPAPAPVPDPPQLASGS